MGFWEWMKDGFLEEAEKKEIKHQENQSSKLASKDRIKQMKKEGIAFCPKCKGTSIQYVERRKRLSLGRAATGGVLLGPVGAGVGAITSKKYKGFVKCMNCGHQWKK